MRTIREEPDNILITGSEGFVGRTIVNYFLSLRIGNRIFGVGRSGKNYTKENGRYSYFPLIDLSSEGPVVKSCCSVVPHVSTVIHLAATTEHKLIVANEENSIDRAIREIKYLINIAKVLKAKTIILASSGKVYENKTFPTTEDSETGAATTLGRMKLAQELILKQETKNTNISVIAARIFNVYGPGQKESFLVPNVISQILKKNPIIVLRGNPTAIRDFVYVADVARSFASLTKREPVDKFKVVNISTGTGNSAAQIAHILAYRFARHKYKIAIEKESSRKGESPVEIGVPETMNTFGFSWIDLYRGLDITWETIKCNM